MPCDSVARKSALIPMVSHALTRMQWALVGAKRFECCSLLPLCFFSMRKQRVWNHIGMTPQTTCLSPYWPHWIVPLTPMVFRAPARMQWALVGAKRLECGSLLPLCLYVQTTCLEPYRHDTANNVSVPISAPLDRAPDPNGFSRAAPDAVGVGRREAFGVRQLAAALSSCPNNVPGTISA